LIPVRAVGKLAESFIIGQHSCLKTNLQITKRGANIMNSKKICSVFVVGIFITLTSVTLSQAGNPAQLPATIGIGTHAVGGGYYASGTGIARLISDKTKIRAVVQPFAGPNAWMPLMESGKLELGLLSSTDAAWAYIGGFGYDKPSKNLRLILRGNVQSATTFTVLKRSGIKKITDLRGKRLAAKYGGNQMLHNLAEAMLKSVGMTWNDVVPVPIPDFQTSIRMIREGRIDAGTSGATTTPAALELNNALGVNVLSFGDMEAADIAKGVPTEKQAILDELVPGCFPMLVKAGQGIIEKDTVLISYAIYLAASAHLSEDAVHLILKTIWENYSDLHPVHPWLKGWRPETFTAGNQPAPYHDGAVKFYKEKGVWSDAMEKRQRQLLKR
jgi:TRAP transporter TAXI family solute receptor